MPRQVIPILNGPSGFRSETAAVCVCAVGFLVLLGSSAPALGQVPVAKPQVDPTIRYKMDIDLDVHQHRVAVVQRVHWTNTTQRPTSKLVFHVVTNHKPSDEQIEIYKRTLESLRVDPRTALDENGRRFHLDTLTHRGAGLEFRFDDDADTHLHVKLREPVTPGESIEIEFKYSIDLPQVQGRVGQYEGVTNLLNWYPILAYYGEDGWDATPFVGWHQPWLNEVGHYDVNLRLPSDHRVATGGHIVSRTSHTGGRDTLKIQGRSLRDFTIVASNRFEVYESEYNGIPVRVLAFPEHQGQARLALQTAKESIKHFSEWFGPYPYQEFELVESYFGWNGNESSGLVMIDERILDAPRRAGIYIEHLVTHEICHQWWYSAVGTDGFREPFMDEGLVAWLTQVRIEDKYGRDPQLLDMPGCGLCRLPNIQYRTLLHSGYSLYRDRGGEKQTLATLKEMGHIHNLFFLVYDRGAQIMGMIHHRLGRDRFFEFLRGVYQKYQFRILRVADFERELESFTGHSWKSFFHNWLRTPGVADWKVEDVEVRREGDQYRSIVRIRQLAEISEPVEVVGLTSGDKRIALGVLDPRANIVPPLPRSGIIPASAVKAGEVPVAVMDESRTWTVELISNEEPAQVVVDPDGWVLDSNPANNRWKRELYVRFNPVFTPLDESPIFQPIDNPSLVFGPNIDEESRIGFRAAMLSANDYRISPFAAYNFESSYQYFSAGVDAIFYNVPDSNWDLGARYEQALLTNVANDPGNQKKVYLRRVLARTTSFIYPNLSYVDIYFRSGDNFFPLQDRTAPTDPRIEDYRNIRAAGIAFHLDTRMPYWNPETGYAIDVKYEHGLVAFGNGKDFDRLDGQVAAVQRLPDGIGWLSETRVAGRLSGGIALPNNGEHFQFGGPGRFRGIRPDRLEGNAFWVASAEWRFPLLEDLDIEFADNFAAVRSVSAAVFYDVGQSYVLNDSDGIENSIGAGLYVDLPLVSFVETLTVRLEYAHSLERNTNIIWFGLYRAF